jgi:hypothetical protein
LSGIRNYNIIDNVVLFPNPSNGSFSITGLKQHIDKLTVINGIGQIVEVLESTDNTINLTLEKGVYFITIVSNGETISKKISIE